MKTNHTPRVQAYLNQLSSGSRATMKAKILDIMTRGPVTIEKLQLYGYKIQTIVARLSDLEDEGLIYKVPNRTKDFSFFHLEENEEKQEERQKEKENEKMQAWAKRGEENGWFQKIAQQSIQ